MVVSVGPYTCTTRVSGQRSVTRRIAAADPASPPVHTSRTPDSGSPGSSASRLNRAVVRNTAVTPPRVSWARRKPRSVSPRGATTTSPPASSGTHSSYVEASKASGECSRTRSWAPPAKDRSAARATMLSWVTTTPLGVPVDPDVNIAYASRPGSTGTAGSWSGMPSASGVRTRTPGGSSRSSRSVTTSGAPACARTSRSRAAGERTSSGTYRPPAFRTPRIVTTASKERSRYRATGVSGPTPSASSRCANRLARRSSSA